MKSLKGKFFVQDDPETGNFCRGEVVDATDTYILVKHDIINPADQVVVGMVLFSLEDVQEIDGNDVPSWRFFSSREDLMKFVELIKSSSSDDDEDDDENNNVVSISDKKGH